MDRPNPIFSCEQPDGYVSDNTDCDDQDNDIIQMQLKFAIINLKIVMKTLMKMLSMAHYFIDNDGDGFGARQMKEP